MVFREGFADENDPNCDRGTADDRKRVGAARRIRGAADQHDVE